MYTLGKVHVPDVDCQLDWGLHKELEDHGFVRAIVTADFASTNQSQERKEAALLIATVAVLVTTLRRQFGIVDFEFPPVVR